MRRETYENGTLGKQWHYKICRTDSKRPKKSIYRGGMETRKEKIDRDNSVKQTIVANATKILFKKRTEGRLLIAYWFIKAKYVS